MIDSRQPVGHTVVVGVFRLEGELEKSPAGRRNEASRVTADAAIAAQPGESWIAIADQAQAEVVVRSFLRVRRAVDRADEVVVEVGGPHRELGLLQGEDAMMIPG